METIRISRLNTSSSSLTTTSNSRCSSNNRSGELFPSLRIHKNGPGPGKYSRNSSIGCLNTDITIQKSPAFSIGKAKRFAYLQSYDNSQSPGPIYYPIIVKNRAPTYYICSRSKELRFNVTPGPGAYSPEKFQNPFKKSIPSISFSRAARFSNYIL